MTARLFRSGIWTALWKKKSGAGGMPKALDTNIVVRLFVDDGSKEVPIARAVFERETVEIPLSVVLECEWVLRSAYRFSAAAICDALTALLSLKNVVVQSPDIVIAAIEAHRLGVDFADVLHLLSVEKSDELLTFDVDFEKRAKRMKYPVPVRIPQLTTRERHP
jgi:predicted nucleic-acid-binding protein